MLLNVVLHDCLRKANVLEIINSGKHHCPDLGPDISDYGLFDVAPLSILSILILLEIFVELPQQIGVYVTEQSLDVISSIGVKCVIEDSDELSYLTLFAFKALSEHLLAICS